LCRGRGGIDFSGVLKFKRDPNNVSLINMSEKKEKINPIMGPGSGRRYEGSINKTLKKKLGMKDDNSDKRRNTKGEFS
jgi:hypothetical protein